MRDLAAAYARRLGKSRLARSAAGVLALKITATLLGIVTGVTLARLMGATGLGAYTWSMAWVALLAFPAELGQDRLVVRETAVLVARGAWAELRGLLVWSNLVVLAAASLLALTLGGLVALTASPADQPLVGPLFLALVLVPLTALTKLRGGVLRGLRFVGLAETPENLARPGLFLLFVVAAVLAGLPLSPFRAIGLHVAAALLAFGLGVYMLRRRLPQQLRGVRPEFHGSRWLSAGIPLMFFGTMTVVQSQADILMLGALRGSADVGIFSVADRGAQLIGFAVVAANSALAPVVARLYEQRQLAELQQLVTRSGRAVALVVAGATLVMIAGGKWFLGLFGPEFVQGYVPLVVLSLAVMIGGFASSVAMLLVMTGHDRDVAVTSGAAALINVVLNLVLIPRYGPTGAAFSTLAGMTVMRWTALALLRRRTGLEGGAFPAFSRVLDRLIGWVVPRPRGSSS